MAAPPPVRPVAADEPSGGSTGLAAMSIDVEDWFQVENLRRVVPRATWQARQLRVEKTMERMLQVMADRGVRSTCFVLGSVAERVPALVRRISEAGHEIASHGYDHELIHESDPASFRIDVERSKSLLEDMSNQEVLGYRAPSFSLTDWALPILRDAGYQYDSSLFPTTLSHSRYGKPPVLRQSGPVTHVDGLTEVSLSCLTFRDHALPWAGGGYFRLIPYPVFKRGVKRILSSGSPYVFYIHPWELDGGQPRLTGLKRSERMRHYLNIEKTESRWSSLLRDFEWVTIADIVSVHRVGNGSVGSSVSPAVPADTPSRRRA
jgi:polysaccharide deacetylase family protein (PEP-CTERM system associated)